jgi:hypothetical protein
MIFSISQNREAGCTHGKIETSADRGIEPALESLY